MTDNIFNDNGVVPSTDSSDNDFTSDVVGSKVDTVAGDSLVSITKRIELAVGGEAIQLRTEQSNSGTVEEDSIMSFALSLLDIDSGAIASADIDITGIVATMEKSTGGGAFSSVGITQPSFSKADGLVSDDYQFLAAEWEIGDVYKLTVSGIEATVGTDTAYVKTMIWCNVVLEEANVEAKIDAIQADIGDPSSRTNLQSLETMLGNPDGAGKSLYGNVGDYVGQINLQSLLASLAIPDTAGKGLFVELATDRLDSATFGLNALKLLIEAVNADLGDFSSQTNLQSLLSTLGIPDVAGKPLYTVLVTDLLASGTYGLSALKTLIDTIQADLDNGTDGLGALKTLIDAIGIIVTVIQTVTNNLPDSGSLTSIAQASDLATLDGKVDAVQADVGNPSSRTNFQDIESMIGVPDAFDSSLDDMIRTGFDSSGTASDEDGSVMERLEALKDQIVSYGSTVDLSGTFSYLDTGNEQDVFEFVNTTRKLIQGAWLDLVNMTQNGTIRVYYKIDGSNYRLVDSAVYVVGTDPVGFYINLNMGITEDIKVTYEESANEGAARDILYSMIYEVKE